MFKLSKVNKYCNSKLELTKSDKSRHIDYSLKLNGNVLPLPFLLRVSRGSGDIDKKNLRGIAKALGLSERELKESIPCRIGRKTVYLALCVRLVQFINQQLSLDPIVHNDGAIAMSTSIELIIKEISIPPLPNPSKEEKKVLQRLASDLEALERFKVINKTCLKLTDTVNKILV